MKGFLRLLLLALSLPTFAGLEQAPPNFDYEGTKAVFVDFTKAEYHLTFSNIKWTAASIANIEFYMPEDGYPIFDSVSNPTKVYVDGKEVDQELIDTPGGATKVRVVKSFTKKGMHYISIYSPIENGVWASLLGVSSGFFIRDLRGRRFLERYIPSNLEYDQYQMTFVVNVKHTLRSHRVFANGEIENLGKNSFRVTYPDHYTASSVFFHLAPIGKYKVLNFTFNSIDGRKIPVQIYSLYWLRNWFFKRKTVSVLKELEADYGPWPHPKVLIYGTKLMGGMEYVGAAETSYVSLGHELQHSYFAKGVTPANGNSGWMDEGIASWRDRGHQTHSEPDYFAFNLGNHNIYTRETDSNSYVKGRSFFSYIDYKLKDMGKTGLKDFLRGYQQKRMYTTVTTQDFISDLNNYSRNNFQADFDRYIFGKHPESQIKGRAPAVDPYNPHHPEVTDEELESIL